MKLMLIAGARPNFMKVASIIAAIDEHNKGRTDKEDLEHVLVHTGQHYDDKMSKVFFEDLSIPRPDVNLEVGSLSHADQTAEIMKRFEPVLMHERPDVLMVVGDVNSTIACTLVAAKVTYPSPSERTRPAIVHVEAGLRSFDRSMPEEVNRVLTDALSDILFITEESARTNLLQEGVAPEKIVFVGNTMIDTLLKHREEAQESPILSQLGLKEGGIVPYGVLTLHRPSNVDEKGTFSEIIEAVCEIGKKFPIVFPVHPRTHNKIREFHLDSCFSFGSEYSSEKIRCLEPLGYIDFLCLMSAARLVLTDSGGIQEETTILGVPCVTMRENTERPVTVSGGTNIVAGVRRGGIVAAASQQMSRFSNGRSAQCVPPLWDGYAGQRIVDALLQSSRVRV